MLDHPGTPSSRARGSPRPGSLEMGIEDEVPSVTNGCPREASLRRRRRQARSSASGRIRRGSCRPKGKPSMGSGNRPSRRRARAVGDTTNGGSPGDDLLRGARRLPPLFRRSARRSRPRRHGQVESESSSRMASGILALAEERIGGRHRRGACPRAPGARPRPKWVRSSGAEAAAPVGHEGAARSAAARFGLGSRTGLAGRAKVALHTTLAAIERRRPAGYPRAQGRWGEAPVPGRTVGVAAGGDTGPTDGLVWGVQTTFSSKT